MNDERGKDVNISSALHRKVYDLLRKCKCIFFLKEMHDNISIWFSLLREGEIRF